MAIVESPNPLPPPRPPRRPSLLLWQVEYTWECPRKGSAFVRLDGETFSTSAGRKRKKEKESNKEIASHYETSFPSFRSFPFRDSRLHRSPIPARNLCKKGRSPSLLFPLPRSGALFPIVCDRMARASDKLSRLGIFRNTLPRDRRDKR